MGCCKLGRELAKACLSSGMCCRDEVGSRIDFVVEALGKSPQAAEPLEQPCLGMRRGQGGAATGHSCLVHGRRIGE